MTYLLQADGSIPNLALMRLARYFRDRGEPVRYVRGYGQRQLWDPPGPVYGSSLFTFTAPTRARMESEWGPIRWGGTGVAIASSLAEIDPAVDWESVQPDYSDHMGEQRSIGFTQRGCRLRCGFCVVPKKEGSPRTVGSLASIWRGEPHPRKLLLLDNDFFGQPREEWRARLAEAREGRFRICLMQGINIRLIDEEQARELASVEYRDQTLSERRCIYTAFDNLRDEARFRRGVATFAAAGIPPKHLRVYMLIGYEPGEDAAARLHRFNVITGLGCEAFPMAYERRLDLIAFQRWAIRGLWRSVPWDAYRGARRGAA